MLTDMHQTITEIWKPVQGYEGYYEVSNVPRVRSVDRTVICKDGRVWFFKGQIMNPVIGKKGYYVINLSKDGKKQLMKPHRLKAIAFIPNPNNYPCLNHRDGNKLNNGLHADGNENLEWCTVKHNVIHAVETGLQPRERKGKIKISELPTIVELIKNKVSPKEIARQYKVSARTIRAIIDGENWSDITGIKKK